MRYVFLSGLICISAALFSQDTVKTIRAIRIADAPKIDGILDEEVWKNVPIATDFIQDEPDYMKPSTQKTEVKVVYDNSAIYVGAFMFDTHPDSILYELGNRDEQGLNTDAFAVGFDTYNKLIDAYIFGVSASGVQMDVRVEDETYDAVWFSAVKKSELGWCAEFRIPYSAFRFPDAKNQLWRVEFQRDIRRRRETCRWTFVPKDKENFLQFFGLLEGVSDIKAPLRLSFTPYLSGYAESAPDYDESGNIVTANSFSYNVGADIKYGIDERFTLDMTLLPDFGQVQSDNKVKNLSYREITYEENRPFFKEGTELFSKNNLFYSRRIGKTPTLFYSVPYLLNSGEVILKNPSQVKLINASKLSGRTNNGLGIGIFNAITDNMYAEVEDSLGNKRKILTEPLTNSNIIVVDQQLKNSSSAYFINTNVVRDMQWNDANVTGAGVDLYNKQNTIEFSASGALSQLYSKTDTTTGVFNDLLGYKYYLGLEKVGGNYNYGLKYEALSNTFDQRDLGYYNTNNFRNYVAFLEHDQFKPWKIFRFSEWSVNTSYSDNFTTAKRTGLQLSLNTFTMLMNYLGVFVGAEISPFKNYDYYEPRVEGMYYINRRYYYSYAGFSTDYRKKVALDLKGNFARYINEGIPGTFWGIDPGLRFRINDKFSIFYSGGYSFDAYNEGFVTIDSTGDVIFGGRILETVANNLRIKYIFTPNMSLSLNGRHYWNTGKYVQFFSLLNDGSLSINNYHEELHDFNYNAFNIDLVYSWIFSPGSNLSIVYKNAIETDELLTIFPRFSENFGNTLASPQTNSISIKFLYYLDYLSLRKK